MKRSQAALHPGMTRHAPTNNKQWRVGVWRAKPLTGVIRLLKIGLMLGLWAMLGASGAAPSSAQAPHPVSSPPDVLVLVFAVPGGPDQVGLTYSGMVPHAQALRDVRALQAATGWNVSGIQVTDLPAPIQKATGKMTGIDFVAPGVVAPQSHTLPVEPFVSSLRAYHHVTLTYLVGSGFAFQGLRDYADNHIKISLAQRGATYTYQIYYHDGRFGRLNLPRYQLPMADARSAQTGGKRRVDPWLLGLVALAAVGAGCIVYAVLARNA